MDKPLFVNLLAKIMKEHGIKDEELAEKSSLSESTIKYFKSRQEWNIRLDSLIKILISTETSFNELIKIPIKIEDYRELCSNKFVNI
ncbi:helix-turn-helix transcriptional regulator [Cytobacillus horneckiae]|uniref:helix-turn-helix domain-containing protein n=1 Tax=Cytobacillus horneckiae TaxID=549687 RepID=UPI00399FD4C6